MNLNGAQTVFGKHKFSKSLNTFFDVKVQTDKIFLHIMTLTTNSVNGDKTKHNLCYISDKLNF